MRKHDVELLAAFAYGAARVLAPVLTWITRELENNVGPKEQAASKALDDAIKAVEEWQAAADESDATGLNAQTARLKALLPNAGQPGPGQVIDVTTGQPIDNPGTTVGPDSPVRTDGGITPGRTETTEGGDAPVAASESESTGTLTDERRETN